MERKLRLAAPAAGGAFVLSLLVALLAGVPFGTALFRSVIAGGAFFAIAVGLVVLVELLLPDLIAGGGDQSAVEDGEDSTDPEASEDDPSDDSASPDSDRPAPSAESGPTEDEDEVVGSRLDIVVEDDVDEDAPEELVEEVEESSAEDENEVMTAAISEEQDGASVEIDDTMLDEMPDIGSFAGSFVSSESGDEGNDDSGPRPGGSGGGGGSGTRQKAGDPRKGFDNATIAKALQTIIGRDDGA